MIRKNNLKEFNKIAAEMRVLIKSARRKLLEFEAALSLSEISQGKGEVITDIKNFFKEL